MSNENPYFVDKGDSRLRLILLNLDLCKVSPVAIGTIECPVNQTDCGIAIGPSAGYWNQGECAVAIGDYAGTTFQGTRSIALGQEAGTFVQGADALAFGYRAGQLTQGRYAIALGLDAGGVRQGTSSVAIGRNAGEYTQGQNAIAIGAYAGQSNQHANTIVLNATGAPLATTRSNSWYVAPITQGSTNNVLYYNTTTKEITYGSGGGGGGIKSGEEWSDYLFWNDITNEWDLGTETFHLGRYAGQTNQQTLAVAIGYEAGRNNQSTGAIAIGNQAAPRNQGSEAVAIGNLAGQTAQEQYAIAIGSQAGECQGTRSIAIGHRAGQQSLVSLPDAYYGGTLERSDNVATISLIFGSFSFQVGQFVQVTVIDFPPTPYDPSFDTTVPVLILAVPAPNTFSYSNPGPDVSSQVGYSQIEIQAYSPVADAIAIGSSAGQINQCTGFIAIGTNAGQFSNRDFEPENGIAIGTSAGQYNQGGSAVAIGASAGQTAQIGTAIAIGEFAGSIAQQEAAIAIGSSAGQTNQGGDTIAIGRFAGASSQKQYAIAIGKSSGTKNQTDYSIAIGAQAGENTQGAYAIGIGFASGQNEQKENAIAIGYQAGQVNQGTNAVAIGNRAGSGTQQSGAIAIGFLAGGGTQGINTVAIGAGAAQSNQGNYSIAIGNLAGQFNQHTQSIILNANASSLRSTTQSAFFIRPIRQVTTLDPQTNDTASIARASYPFANPGVLRYSAASLNVSGNPIYEVIEDTTNYLVPPAVYTDTVKNIVNLRLSLSPDSPTNGNLDIVDSTTLYLHAWNSDVPEIALYDPFDAPALGVPPRWILRRGSAPVMAFDMGPGGLNMFLPNRTYLIFAVWEASASQIGLAVFPVEALGLIPYLGTQDGVYIYGGQKPNPGTDIRRPDWRYIGMVRTSSAYSSSMYNAKNQPYNGNFATPPELPAKSSKCFCVNYYNTIEKAFNYWFASTLPTPGPYWLPTLDNLWARPRITPDPTSYNDNNERARIEIIQAQPYPSATAIQYSIYSNDATTNNTCYVNFAVDGIDNTQDGTFPEVCFINVTATAFAEFNWDTGTYAPNEAAGAIPGYAYPSMGWHVIDYKYRTLSTVNSINEHSGVGIVARVPT